MDHNGTPSQKIVPIGPGEAHIQNEIVSYKCHICGCDEHDDMALLRYSDKKMVFACLAHKGIVQEFVRQYRRPPLGWDYIKAGEQNEMGQAMG